MLFVNLRWVRFGDARCAFFYEFASGAHWPLGVLGVFCEFAFGACLRTCVGHVRVGCVLRKRVGRFSTNLRRAHIGHLASCVLFVNLRWARVGGLALAICALDGVGDSRWIIFR